MVWYNSRIWYDCLTHWGRVTHIWVSKLSIIGSNNGLSPGRRQAIIWTNAGILLIWTIGTNFNEMLIEIHTFSVKKIHLKMSSANWRPFCLGLNVLRCVATVVHCSDVLMSTMASQITSLTLVYSIVYSGADQRKHQNSQSLAFVMGIHRWPVNSHTKDQ